MTVKSDNEDHVGVHTFEIAGLGEAPFRSVGFVYRVGPIKLPGGHQIGSPGQPMGTCDYCGNGIADCFVIESACGKRSEVGCKCIERSGDEGIIKAYKNNKAYRTKKREQRHVQEARRIEKIAALVELHRDAISVMPHPYDDKAAKGMTFLDYAEWTMDHAGNAGRCKLYTRLNRMKPLTDAELAKYGDDLAAIKAAADSKLAAAQKVADDKAAAEQAKRDAASKDNQWLIDRLELAYQGEFVQSMSHQLTFTPIADLPQRAVAVLKEIYAKTYGRANSKKYFEACDRFDANIN